MIQGLGWFLRRTVDPLALGAFYEQALGLPRMRSWNQEGYVGAMMWAGDVCTLETNLINDAPQLAPGDSQCIPVFRTFDLAQSLDRLAAAGAVRSGEERTTRADTYFFKDPEGYPLCIEFVKDDTIFAIDKASADAWARGPAMLPGGICIDGAVQKLSRVLHLTSDPAGDAAYLVDRLGLADVGAIDGSPVLALGETVLLELRASKLACDRPDRRDSVRDTWIAREFCHDELQKTFAKKGDTSIEAIEFPGGQLDYFVTPSNRMFGFQERRPYNPDVPTTQMVEDLASRSRWLASAS